MAPEHRSSTLFRRKCEWATYAYASSELSEAMFEHD